MTSPTSSQGRAAGRERPILFSGEMVRAILEGRKTQTRRVVKPQPPATVAVIVRSGPDYTAAYPNRSAIKPFEWTGDCPYGQPGDRLWVRETWATERTIAGGHTVATVTPLPTDQVVYAADGAPLRSAGVTVRAGGEEWAPKGRWRPSIHMPRWASRITLEITDVRVERVREITEADCVAEGFASPTGTDFADLWDSLNADRGYGWESNPFVWVLSFRRVDTAPPTGGTK